MLKEIVSVCSCLVILAFRVHSPCEYQMHIKTNFVKFQTVNKIKDQFERQEMECTKEVPLPSVKEWKLAIFPVHLKPRISQLAMSKGIFHDKFKVS